MMPVCARWFSNIREETKAQVQQKNEQFHGEFSVSTLVW
jgi:hypothetical protein